MNQQIQQTVVAHSQKIVLLAILMFLLSVGAVGEVAATAPDCAAVEQGGQLFKCENHAPLIKLP